MTKKKGTKLSLWLISVGLFMMALGIGGSVVSSSVSIGVVGINGISPFSATAIGVGAIVFLSGIGLYLKGK